MSTISFCYFCISFMVFVLSKKKNQKKSVFAVLLYKGLVEFWQAPPT